eukprot:4740415-Pyramimonas_sp.AAC.1
MFRDMHPEALPFNSEHSHAWKQLYEVPGGDQVGGSPPVPDNIQLFEKCLQELSASTPNTLTRERRSTRRPAVTR